MKANSRSRRGESSFHKLVSFPQSSIDKRGSVDSSGSAARWGQPAEERAEFALGETVAVPSEKSVRVRQAENTSWQGRITRRPQSLEFLQRRLHHLPLGTRGKATFRESRGDQYAHINRETRAVHWLHSL